MKKLLFIFVILFFSVLINSCSKKKENQKEKSASELNTEIGESFINEENTVISKSKLFIDDEEVIQKKSVCEFETDNSDDENVELNRLIEETETAEEIFADSQYEDLPDLISTGEQSDKNVIKSADNQLKIFTFEEELLLPEVSGDYRIVTSVNKHKVSRSFFDSHGRLFKKEKWLIPDYENSVLEKVQEYIFEEDSFVPLQQIITEKDAVSYVTYNANSNPEYIKKYIIEEDEKTLSEEINYEYDEENRLIKSLTKQYIYNQKTKKLKENFYKKYIYTYRQEKGIPADYEYFENEVMKIKNKYSSEKGRYTSQIFFDENYSVKTFYKNDVKYRDIYYLNGVVARDVRYDQ